MSLALIMTMLGHSQTPRKERHAHHADNPVQSTAEEVGRTLSEKIKN